MHYRQIGCLISLVIFFTWIPLAFAETMPEKAQRHEYKAEQVLSVPDVIGVLISLSNKQIWQVRGNCGLHLIDFKNVYPNRDGWVNTKTGFSLTSVPEARYESKQVDGLILKYNYIANTCPPGEHQKDYNCFGEALIEVEIVSKNLVKIIQKPIRCDPNNYIPRGERSCTFQRN